MEIRYKRTYSPAKGKRYTAGEITAMLGYAMEIADPRVKLKEGKLAPGEICLLLFGITPEEYHANLRATAIRDLKLSIALDALYAAKDFTLNESDIDMIFEQMAPGRGAEMKHGYILSGRLHLAEEMAQRAKARRWLSETAKLER